ncbi:MFS transporter [Acetanaerobacterium elongatum]|uniref:Fucose permease n=1 Tax=Acetanaerobacterium elongatum TaxID=258515 RepID=A0A1H0GBV9_9FIRM|nr:MFS transporter [Acetanaerobacterium elongatum]SDO04324.1 Fucose permease [Acetanaerobacterium elongatum]
MATLFLILIYAAFISLGLPDSLLGVVWPVMQPEFGVPYGYAGILSIIVSGGTIISSLFSGKVLKRFGTGRVTFVSVLLTAVSLLGFRFAPSFIWAILLGIPLGLGAGSVDAGLNSYVAAHYKSRHMSWLHCFWGVGAMIGPVIMSGYIKRNDWRDGFLTISIIQFVLVVVLLFAIPLWDKVAKQSSGEAKSQQTVPEAAQGSFWYPLKLKGVKPVLFTFMLYCALEATMGLWGSSFLINVKGFDAAEAARWVSLFYAGITAGRFLSGFITMKVSNKLIIRAGELIILAGAVLLLLPILPREAALIGFVLVGLGCAPIYPCMIHETPARFGKENSQAVIGFQMAVAYVGSTFFPPIFGFIASSTTIGLFPFFITAYIFIILFCSERVNAFMRQKLAAAKAQEERTV